MVSIDIHWDQFSCSSNMYLTPYPTLLADESSLHWLPVKFRVQCQVLAISELFMFRCLEVSTDPCSEAAL